VHPIRTKPTRQRLLENLNSDRQRLVTDAEVLLEILHRYVAINRRDAIQPAFEALLGIADEVLVADRAAALLAKEIVMGHRQMSARYTLHLWSAAAWSLSEIARRTDQLYVLAV
jgi:uncharacterized protein